MIKGATPNKTQQKSALIKCGEIYINDDSTDAYLFCSFCADDDQECKYLRTLEKFIAHIRWHRSEDLLCIKDETSTTFEIIEVEPAGDLCESRLQVEPYIETSLVKKESERDEPPEITGDELINILDLYKKCPCLWHKNSAAREKDIIEATFKMLTIYYNKCTKQTKPVQFVKDFLEKIGNAFLEEFMAEQGTMSESSRSSPWYFPYLMFLLMSDEKRLDESIYTDYECTICRQECCSQEDLWDHLYQCHLELDDGSFSSIDFAVEDDTKSTEDDVPKRRVSCEHLEKFIEAYKGQPRLWNKQNKEYGKHKLREESYGVLLEILQEKDPAATIYDVKKKIKRFRNRFAYERRKIEQNKLVGVVYKPVMWCYKQLLFLADEMNFKPPGKQHFMTNFKCSACRTTFASKSALLDHMKYSHDKKAFQSSDGFFYCAICNGQNKTIHSLIHHLRRSHTNNPKACLDCGTKYRFISALIKHRAKVHKDLRPIKCEQCGKGFANLCRMKAHSITHLDVKDRPYRCEYCGSKFSHQTNLKVHIRRHTKDFRYRCENCDFTAATSTELRFHMFTHTKDYPCICDICGKGFRSNGLLAAHQNEYHSDKMFACKWCGKQFKSMKKLKYHSEGHKPAPDQVCTFCGRKFFRNSSLRKHIRTKHKETLEEIDLLEDLLESQEIVEEVEQFEEDL